MARDVAASSLNSARIHAGEAANGEALACAQEGGGRQGKLRSGPTQSHPHERMWRSVTLRHGRKPVFNHPAAANYIHRQPMHDGRLSTASVVRRVSLASGARFTCRVGRMVRGGAESCADTGISPARQLWRRARQRTRRPCEGVSAGSSRSALPRLSLARETRPE
jgi:hypothetical protein